MRTGGGHETQLTNHSLWDLLRCFSPDGRFIAFTSERDGAPSAFFPPDIFRMRTDGSQPTNVTRTPMTAEFDCDWQPLPDTRGGLGDRGDESRRRHARAT